MDFSVLMSVYKNSKAAEVAACLKSLYAQTAPSNNLVIVLDGPVGEDLQALLTAEAVAHPEITLCPLEKNVGLGEALKYGMDFCKNELVARMDTDDLAVADRFEKQLECFALDNALSIVGADIAEFTDDPENIVSYRRVPQAHEDICTFLKKRCPFNHMTVMFKKSEVTKAGGYLAWHYNEDSYLWARMYLAGCKFKNLPAVLCLARIDQDTFKRRGGYKYYKSERNLFRFMRQNKIIGRLACFKANTLRFCVYVLTPNFIRERLFKKAVREKK